MEKIQKNFKQKKKLFTIKLLLFKKEKKIMDSSNQDHSAIDMQDLSFSDSMTPHSTNLSDKIITQEKVKKILKFR